MDVTEKDANRDKTLKLAMAGITGESPYKLAMNFRIA